MTACAGQRIALEGPQIGWRRNYSVGVRAGMNLNVLLATAFGHLVVDMHQGALPVLLPVLRTEYGLTYAMVTFLVVVSQVSSSVIQPAFGWISDKVSTRWLLPASLLLAGTGFLALPLTKSYGAAVAAILLMGIGVAGYHPESSKLAFFSSGERKASAMSIFAIGGNIGMAMGPMVMGLLLILVGLRGAIGFFLIAALTALLFWRMTPVLYRYAPSARSSSSGGVARAGEEAGRGAIALLLVVIMLRSWTQTSMSTFIPLYYVSHLGMPTQVGSSLVTAYLAAGAVGTIIGGWVADRWGRRQAIIASMLLAVPFTYLFPHTSGLGTYVVLILAGLSLFLSFAVTTVLGQEMMPRNVGLASGLTLGFSVGTGGLGATLLGFVADTWGIEAAVAVISVMPVLGGLLAFGLPARKFVQQEVATGASG